MNDDYEECADCRGCCCPGVLFPVGEPGEAARVQVCKTCNGFAFELDAAENVAELLDGPWRPMDTPGGVILVDGSDRPLGVELAQHLVKAARPLAPISEI